MYDRLQHFSSPAQHAAAICTISSWHMDKLNSWPPQILRVQVRRTGAQTCAAKEQLTEQRSAKLHQLFAERGVNVPGGSSSGTNATNAVGPGLATFCTEWHSSRTPSVAPSSPAHSWTNTALQWQAAAGVPASANGWQAQLRSSGTSTDGALSPAISGYASDDLRAVTFAPLLPPSTHDTAKLVESQFPKLSENALHGDDSPDMTPEVTLFAHDSDLFDESDTSETSGTATPRAGGKLRVRGTSGQRQQSLFVQDNSDDSPDNVAIENGPLPQRILLPHPTAGTKTQNGVPGIAALADLRKQVFGGDAEFDTPFGRKAMVYADYAASGRLLKPMEAWLEREVYPWFANVHSEVRTSGPHPFMDWQQPDAQQGNTHLSLLHFKLVVCKACSNVWPCL